MNRKGFDIPITTYAFINLERGGPDREWERGDRVVKDGCAGEGRLVVVEKRKGSDYTYEVIVIAWKGYGENPGSRYSGLYSYYPARTEVFVYDHIDAHGRVRYRSVIKWETRPKKRR